MKKITYTFLLLFFCSLGYSQTTLGLYTEREVTSTQALNTDFGTNATANNSYPTGGVDEGTDGGTEIYSVSANSDASNTQWILNYNPRIDFSPYNTFYISLKSTSAQPTVLRIQDAADISATLNLEVYGMEYDGEWHTLAIPVADFTTAESTIDLTVIKNVFIVKSDPAAAADVVASTYVFYIDDVFLSTSITLSSNSFKFSNLSMYPNPVVSEININSDKEINNVKIYNLAGQKILEFNESKKLDVSSLKNGVYFLNAVIEGENSVSKFIKN